MRLVWNASIVLLATAVQAAPPRAREGAEQEPAAFKVIVNAANPAREARRARLSEMFLRRVANWPDGRPVAPVDQSITFPIRERFSRRIIGRSALAVQNYWQQQVFAGRGVPPPVRLTDEEVIVFVEASPGAVGYVSADAGLPETTKTLKLLE